MAKGGIQLDIGTNYDGEGFRKLDNDMKSAGQTVKRVGGTVSKVANEFESLGGTAGKAAGKITGIFADIAAGGLKMALLTVVIQGAVKGINSLFEYLNKTNDAIKKVEASFKDGLANAIKKVNGEITKFGDTYSKVLTKRTGQADIAKFKRGEELKRMEYDRQDANVMIDGVGQAIVNRDLTEKIEAKKVANAKANITDIQNRKSWVEKAIQVSKNNEQHTKNNWQTYNQASMNAANRGDKVAQAEYYNKSRYAKAENSKWHENTKKLEQELEKLKVEEIKAQEEYITLKKAADSAIIAAEKKTAEAFKKIDDELKRQQKKRLEEEAKIKETENNQTLEEQKQVIKDLDDLIAKLADAIAGMRDFAGGGGNGNNNNNNNNPWQKPDKAGKKAQNQAAILQGQANNLGNLIFDRNGNLKKGANKLNVDLFLNLVHEGANPTQKQMEGLKKRRDELQKLAGYTNKKMSDTDTDQLAKLNDILKGEDAKKKLKELEEEKRRQTQLMIEDASSRTKYIKLIKDKMDNLGV